MLNQTIQLYSSSIKFLLLQQSKTGADIAQLVRDRSEITGGGHYLCREGHHFFEQNFGRVTIFLPKLREGHNFFKAKPADLNQSVLVTIFQLTGPSA